MTLADLATFDWLAVLAGFGVGAIFGLTRATTEKELAQAALEAVCYQTRDLLDALDDDADPWRASDHDPVLLGLDLAR